MSDQPSRLGRPPLAQLDDLRRRALDLLVDAGYTSLTMTQIASELGMSVRTLHRYFPTKSDIVWGGLEDALGSLQRAFDAAPQDMPVMRALRESVSAVFEQDADEERLSRARFRAIATTPELRSARPEVFSGWRQQTAEFIAARTGAASNDLLPIVVAAGIQAVIGESLTWWATHVDAGTPAATVRAALLEFEATLASGARESTRPTPPPTCIAG